MREPKYRVWDVGEKIMREVAMLRWEDGRLSRIAGYWKDTRNNGWTDYDPVSGKYILMESTGLKDKMGKEIFENDILDGFWECYFSDGSFLFRRFNTFCAMKGQEFCREHEVIGNLHEHPHLIKP